MSILKAGILLALSVSSAAAAPGPPPVEAKPTFTSEEQFQGLYEPSYADVASHDSPSSLPGERLVVNGTVYGVNSTCLTESTPSRVSRITGSGIFQGVGLFVGVGVFEASSSAIEPQFVLSAANWSGNATDGCVGDGLFVAGSPTSQLLGSGTLIGTGVLLLPTGVIAGAGSYVGTGISFTGEGVLTTELGTLVGIGNVTGENVLCNGYGFSEGTGAYFGEGILTGTGSYIGSNGLLFGTGVLEGWGECETGEVAVLPPNTPLPPMIQIIKNTTDIIAAQVNNVVRNITAATKPVAMEPVPAPFPAGPLEGVLGANVPAPTLRAGLSPI